MTNEDRDKALRKITRTISLCTYRYYKILEEYSVLKHYDNGEAVSESEYEKYIDKMKSPVPPYPSFPDFDDEVHLAMMECKFRLDKKLEQIHLLMNDYLEVLQDGLQ